ncbi:hypothetical protein ACQRIT_007916 [Beauveria bassiana]
MSLTRTTSSRCGTFPESFHYKPGGPVIVIAGGEVTAEYHKPLLTNSVGALLARFHLGPAARPGAPLLRQQLPRAGPGRRMHPQVAFVKAWFKESHDSKGGSA